MSECPVCLSVDRFSCQEWPQRGVDGARYDCEVCGTFIVTRSANLSSQRDDFTRAMRAVLSHRTRMKTDTLGSRDDVPVIGSDTIRRLIEDRPRLPSPGQQATNVIRFIGEHVGEEFESIDRLPASFQAIVGAPNRRYAERTVRELMERGLVTGISAGDLQHPDVVINVDLSLAGWEVFEAQQRGDVVSSFGFIALKFGDSTLDPLLANHVKPKLAQMGYSLVDLRDVSRAGVIDNLLRAQIRDSAFVIVDLTHDNLGAYWEAGYAEGLGKPVIYICEKSKFEDQKTHFDTNHCTTVMWGVEQPDEFVAELGATIRRSLNYN